MIIFSKVRWKNLLSTGNIFNEIDLRSSATTLIVGENGSGKSTLLDAICFGLFGKPFRKVNKPQLINSVNEKDSLVEIEFTVGKVNYKVTRGQKPKRFEIYKSGNMIDQSSKVRDYQKFLEESILGFNYKTFTQIVILGSSSFIPFMQLTALDRRSIVEELLDIGVFTIMNMLSKQKLGELKDTLKDNDYNIKVTEEKLLMQKEHLSELKKTNKESIKKLQNVIDEHQKEIQLLSGQNDDTSKRVTNLHSSIGDEEETNITLLLLTKYEHKIATNLNKRNKELKFFQDNEECPVCTQPIGEDFQKKMIGESSVKIGELKKGQESLESEKRRVGKRRESIVKILEDITKLQQNISTRTSNITMMQKYITDTQKEIDELQQKKPNTGTSLKALNSDHKKFETERELIVEEQHYNSIVSDLLKDSGIKTKIVKQYLPVMNQLINKYLAEMDFFVSFELDENFNETMKSRYRDDFCYANFSEGEKQRIDIALLLTWRSIARMRNSTNTNLLIFDEVFDASLDANGCEELIKMLHSISGDTNIIVISHKTDVLLDKFPNTIKFVKKGDFSKIVDV
jgi:DNA repair exonuclease SbcCD ATPase subunit